MQNALLNFHCRNC